MNTTAQQFAWAGLIGFASLSSTAAQAPLSRAEIAQCEQKIQATMKRLSIPGLSVAVGRGGHIVWTKGYGYADVENKVSVTPATVFRLASISKPMTAVATMQLVEEGLLDLDAPVHDYVTHFPAKRFSLTTRHLLSHQGGVRHYKAGEIFSTRHYETVAAGLQIFAADPLVHKPGDKFLYTTYGFNVIGAAVASVGKQRFIDYLHANIFKPAGMAETREDAIATIIPHRAQGYRRGPDGEILNARIVDTSNKIPGGGLCGTARDLVRFSHALRAGKLLKPATLDLMWTPARTKAGAPLKYGLGFRIIKPDKPRVVGHSGGQPRVSTMMLMMPDDGVAVGLMCNLENSRLLNLAVQLGEVLAQRR